MDADINGLNFGSLEYLRMSTLLSPTDCYFCRSDKQVQKFKFPCECIVYAHPDCYANYLFTSRDIKTNTVRCVKCNDECMMKDHVVLQINIPPEKDDDMRPLTRKELRREKCIVGLVMGVQGLFVTSLIAVVVWMYVKLILGTFPQI